MNVGVIANPHRADASTKLQELDALAKKKGIVLYTCGSTHDLLPTSKQVNQEEFAEHIDVLLALGGDGTLLYSSRILNGANVPILGINLGHLGFLTSLREDQLETAVDAIISGDYKTTERTVIDCIISENGKPKTWRALNEVAIGWGPSARMAHIELKIDDQPITVYSCDGLIISTPTGSTGHSLSAGGPIVHPNTPAWIINVMCPHTLTYRPIVLPDNVEIEVGIKRGSKKLLIAIDGQDGGTFDPGDTIEIRKAKRGVTLISLAEQSYFKVLSEKLDWRGSHVN